MIPHMPRCFEYVISFVLSRLSCFRKSFRNMSVNKVLVDGPSHSKHTSSPVTDHYHMGAMEENPMYSAYNMLMDQQSPSRPLRSNYYPYQDFSLDAPTYSMSSSYPIHPDVRLKKLPFYDKIADLLKPSSLGKWIN
ncbi:hypothetical protein PR048_026742 [Dryococelus australis]|uniref:PINIT domain-containing protein n=1 Tax=Dryococelus australis TaxID=614101 RepID=A0ABQ9GM76_9NEOP|nr:hypothetical protein PR048_026742 [Dryococelus australis]